MNIKEFISRSLNNESLERMPIFYRGDLIINEMLLKYYGLKNIETDYMQLTKELGADFYTGGVTLSDFHTYAPKYIGPVNGKYNDPNFFFTFGINSKATEYLGKRAFISYFDDPPLYDLDKIEDLKKYNFPKADWYDFSLYKNILSESDYVPFNEIKRLEEFFLGTLLYSSIFMISSYMRDMAKLLMDLVSNKQYAEFLIDTIGEICLEVSRQNLKKIGNVIEIYGMWDDVAMQTGLIMDPDTWRKFYKPWYKKIIEEAKKYNLIVMFHCCGSCVDIIPDFIEIGVDILDPIQTSANKMDLKSLKKSFGKNICFHGGLDIQQLLVHGKTEDIKSEVRNINELFKEDGGILLGPSHYITFDTPIENILAIYKAF